MLFFYKSCPLKRHSLALFLAAVCACFPWLLFAANPDPPLPPFVADAWAGFDYPLLKISLSLAIGAILLVAVLKRRHRPELLAVCLALSIMLHLLSLSLFSVVPIRRAELTFARRTVVHRIEVGTPTLRESLVSQSVRTEPLPTERVDSQNRLATDRAARNEPVKEVISKTQATLPETEARTAGHGEIKTPAAAPSKKNLDEPLQSLPNRPIEVATVKIAIPQNDQRAPQAKQIEPGAREKRFDIEAVAQAAVPQQAVKPDATRAGLKDPSQLPARAKIDLVAVEMRQPEVKDAIQPAVTKSTVDRLELRANEVADARGSRKDERVAPARPSADVKLDKLAGGTPRTAAQRMTAAAQPAGQPRMSADSLAAGSPGLGERKKNEVVALAPGAAATATHLEPVRMSDVQPLVAVARPDAPGQVPAGASAGQRELTTSKEQDAGLGVNAAGGKPQAEVQHAAPSKDPIRIGLGLEAIAKPTSKAPAVQEVISDVSAERPGLPSLGNPAPKMELVPDDRRAAGPAADKLGPSDLAAVKTSGSLGSAQVAAFRIAPKRAGGSQAAGVMPGTLIEGSAAPLQAREGAAAAVKEQLALAQAGGGNHIGQGLADIGAPAQAVESVVRGGSSGEGSDVRPVALVPARTKQAGAPSEAGGIVRLSPAGRSDLPVSQDSFVGQGQGAGVAAPRAASSIVSEGEQVETSASLALALGDAKALAGRMNIEGPQGAPMTDSLGGGGGRAPAELSLEKAEGDAAVSGTAIKRLQAPGSAAGGQLAARQLAGSQSAAQAETLVVQSDLQVAGSATASGTAGKESLAALNTSASASDSSGPTLVAPTVMRQGSAAGGTAEAGSGPAGGGTLQVAKAGGADLFLFEPQGGGGLGGLAETMNDAGGRDPSRMALGLEVAPTKVPVTSDISASSSGQEARRSFLTVGTTPNPEFVPEKAIYKMRKPDKRRQFIKELGGTAQTEEAVEQALAWLSRAQSDDGRWDVDGFKTLKECGGAGDLANEDVGMTGLVLLAYLGAGYTHLDGAYQETVRKGLDWLLNCEKNDGDIRGAGQMYGQAMATAALCESYSLTGDERLLAPTQRAVKFIVDAQTPESGWRYMSHNDSDTSVTGWQILALKSAQIAGFTVPDQTFKWMDLWLDKVRQGAHGGLYAYKPGHVVTPVMTAEGAFCQLFMGGQASARAQAESAAYIMQNLPAWNPESHSVHIYYWYYATLTMYLSGAKEFEAWNAALTKALLQGRSTSGPAKGSWDPVDLLGSRGGRVYSTAVGALCLEVYYRFLPLYKQQNP